MVFLKLTNAKSVPFIFLTIFSNPPNVRCERTTRKSLKSVTGRNVKKATVTYVRKTIKADWLTRYLSQKQFWVGGTEVTYMANISTTAVQTIRFFRANTSKFLVVYILEFIEPFDRTIDYETVVKSYLSVIPIESNFTLAIWRNKSETFAILSGGTFRQNLGDKQVLDEFKKFDPALIGRSGYLKPLNRSFTDFFHLWSRQNMRGFANDIDAFFEFPTGIEMLELKRPKEKIDTWRPYRADSVNYLQFTDFCSQLGYGLTNIAYSEAELLKIKVFKDVIFDGQNLKYLTANHEINFVENIFPTIKTLDFRNEISRR